jgi:LPXTG-site transpeptidase (sortase) family protein
MRMPFSPRLLLASRNARIGAAVGVLAVVALVVGGVALAMSGGSSNNDTVVAPTPTSTPRPSPSPSPVPSATPVPSPTVPPVVPGANPDDMLVIEKANVDAPITLKAVPANGGALPSPNGPDDVVYYDFAGFPGLGGYPGAGGTIVISGHVDYGIGYCHNGTLPPPCTAVFWDLSKLEKGDIIEIRLSNGVFRYQVTGSDNLGADDQEKWNDVWKSAEGTERIVLITCGGDFNRDTHEYDKRHVIYGERITGDST